MKTKTGTKGTARPATKKLTPLTSSAKKQPSTAAKKTNRPSRTGLKKPSQATKQSRSPMPPAQKIATNISASMTSRAKKNVTQRKKQGLKPSGSAAKAVVQTPPVEGKHSFRSAAKQGGRTVGKNIGKALKTVEQLLQQAQEMRKTFIG